MTPPPEPAAGQAIDRPLEAGEVWWWMAHRKVCGHAVVGVRIRGPIREQDVRTGLDAAQLRHPMLGVHIEAGGQRPRLVSAGTPGIPLRVVERRSSENWLAIGEQELERNFDWRAGPFVRAVLVAGEGVAELLFVVHHLVADGVSGAVLIGDTIDYAAQAAAGRPPAVTPLPVRPPLSRMFPPAYVGLRGSLAAARMAARGAGQALLRPRRLRPDKRVDPRERRSRIILPVRLSPEATAALLKQCDRRGATLHSAVCAATLRAAAREIGGSRVRLACQTPLDIRKMLRPRVRRDEVGNFASAIATFHDVLEGGDPWRTAEEVVAGLRDGFFRGEHFAGEPFARLIGRAYGQAERSSMKYGRVMERGNPTSLVVSTVAPMEPGLSVGPFELEGLAAGLAMSWYGLFGVSAGVAGGRLSVGFVHLEPAIRRPRAERLAQDVIDGLNAMAAA